MVFGTCIDEFAFSFSAKDPVLLLVELVLFVPIVLIGFSWWYWRLNHLSRIGKGKEAITFDKKPTPFSYFAKTASVVVSDTTEHGVCETDVARMIRILNGFVVLDIFGLTLSRAVGLVITLIIHSKAPCYSSASLL